MQKNIFKQLLGNIHKSPYKSNNIEINIQKALLNFPQIKVKIANLRVDLEINSRSNDKIKISIAERNSLVDSRVNRCHEHSSKVPE